MNAGETLSCGFKISRNNFVMRHCHFLLLLFHRIAIHQQESHSKAPACLCPQRGQINPFVLQCRARCFAQDSLSGNSFCNSINSHCLYFLGVSPSSQIFISNFISPLFTKVCNKKQENLVWAELSLVADMPGYEQNAQAITFNRFLEFLALWAGSEFFGSAIFSYAGIMECWSKNCNDAKTMYGWNCTIKYPVLPDSTTPINPRFGR